MSLSRNSVRISPIFVMSGLPYLWFVKLWRERFSLWQKHTVCKFLNFTACQIFTWNQILVIIRAQKLQFWPFWRPWISISDKIPHLKMLKFPNLPNSKSKWQFLRLLNVSVCGRSPKNDHPTFWSVAKNRPTFRLFSTDFFREIGR